jgi:hypothetical protein
MMTDRQGHGANRAMLSQWQERFRCAAERAALWWVAHVAEVLLVLAVVLAVAAALLGLLPDADLSGLFDPNPARAEAR